MNPINYFKSICKDSNKIETKIQGKEFLLGKYYDLKACKKCKSKKFIKSKRQKLLEIQTKIQLDHQIKEQQKNDQNNQPKPSNPKLNQYQMSFFQPLHKLWLAYMSDLIEQEKSQQSASLKILRGDFVGAKIEVVYSKIQSYIGHKGIIIKQNLRTFVMICQQNNRIITLLKNQIVFLMTAAGKNYVINGNTLVYRPSDRSKHKFKFKNTDKINLDFLENFLIQND